jgi:putative transposase
MTTENYRIVGDAHVYFVTYSIVEWLPVFISKDACKIVTDSLNFCYEQKSLCTSAFVIMPTHMHAVVFDKEFDNDRLIKSLGEFRKFTGRSLCDLCDKTMPSCFGKTLRECSVSDRTRRFWQPSRHPIALETERFWQQKVDYLHINPVRKGLVSKAAYWRFSSANYYLSDGLADCDVVIQALDWG